MDGARRDLANDDRDMEALAAGIEDFIERCYNRCGLHSALALKGGRGHCRVGYLLAFGFRAVGAVLAFVIAVRTCDSSGPFVVADGAGAGPGAADLHSGG